VFKVAVLLKVPLKASYNSALAIEPKWLPATLSTFPLASRCAP
jgi:hypothetical protein